MTRKRDRLFTSWRLIKADLRLALGRGFCLAVALGVAFRALFIVLHLCMFKGSIWQALHNSMCTLYLQKASITGLSGDLLLICVLPTFAYSAAIGQNLRSGSYWCWVVRSGKLAYVTSKFLSCAVSSFISYCLAELLVAGGLTILIPFYLHSYNPSDAYVIWLNRGKPVSYFFFLTCHHACAATIYGNIGMLVSVFVRGDLASNVIPVSAYFLFSRILATFIPKLVMIPAYLTTSILDAGSWHASLLLMGISVLILSGAMCLIAWSKLKKEE